MKPTSGNHSEDKNSNGVSYSHNILNTLLTICLILGFACSLLFVLPDQLKKASAFPLPPQRPKLPRGLSAIVPLGREDPQPSPSPKAQGTIARFAPDLVPGQNNTSQQITSKENAAEIYSTAHADDDIIPAGAGVAIDDESAEAHQALAFKRQETSSPTLEELPTDSSSSDTSLPTEGSLLTNAATPTTFKAFPISALARRDPSALDTVPAKQKKTWLITPPGLEADVSFWRDIYTKYDCNKIALHHPRYLGIVYDVVDVTDIAEDPRLNDIERQKMRENRVESRRREITESLLKLAGGPLASSLSDEELKLRKLFENTHETNAFHRAAKEDGVRSQTGQRDKFIPGLKYAGRYMGEIESIFEAYGLPRELTRLIFVESMFNPRAVSSVGASGIWQFMPATGRLYLQVNDLIDERNDPIAATHAAAKLLRQNYDSLGTWPLAINAYNAGRGRLKQAVARVGTTDIGRIIREFEHPGYGFASRNFFLEFLAALDVAEHAEKYFGPIEYDAPLRFEILSANYTISLPDVTRFTNIPIETILELNPGLTGKVAIGSRLIPMGFNLRVPENKSELFLAASARAPRSRTGPIRHVVQDGESLQTIARLYGVSPQQIVKSNQDMGWRVRPGQTIVVPVGKR